MHASHAKRDSSAQERKIHDEETLAEGAAASPGASAETNQTVPAAGPWTPLQGNESVSFERFVE